MKSIKQFYLFSRRVEIKLYWNGVALAFIVDNYDTYIVVPFIEIVISHDLFK